MEKKDMAMPASTRAEEIKEASKLKEPIKSIFEGVEDDDD